MKSGRVWCVGAAVLALGCLGMVRGDGPSGLTAYVVFEGQVVAVDTQTLKVTGRLDFADLMGPAHCATMLPAEHAICVAGECKRGWGIITIRVPRLRVEHFQVLSSYPEGFLDLQQIRRAGSGLQGVLVKTRTPGHSNSREMQRLDFIDGRTLTSRGSILLNRSEEDCPDEELIGWCTTPDSRRLLLLTSGGHEEQSYLREYALPSLARIGKVPLLDIPDDSAVDVFIDQ